MLGSALLTLGLHKLMPSSFPAPVYLLDGLRDARVPYRRVLEVGGLALNACTLAN